MTTFSPLLEQLIQSLRCLPGVGPKSAQRMAMHLLMRGREGGKQLAMVLTQALQHINRCQECRTFSETPRCPICNAGFRDSSLLCIVENPIDIAAIEQTGCYKGKYFVLLGHLSPLDGIGPDAIGIPELAKKFANKNTPLQEIILATNPTVEGEATAHYIRELAAPYGIQVTRIARGVALGSELDYVDPHTLAHALARRGKVG